MSRSPTHPLAALNLIAAVLTLLFGTAALAHATLVLGSLGSDPAASRPGEPFTLNLELVDPTQVPVEDAWVVAEFRPEGAPEGAETVNARFEESETAGVYRAQVTLPERGTYALLLRDQTYRQEEAQAELTFNVGRETSPENLSFVFPPTATGPQSLTVWLAWLIGLPLLAAIVVTVLVWRRGEGRETTEGQAESAGETA